MTYSIVNNDVVENLIELSPQNAADFPNAVPVGDYPVAIGDSYIDGVFYRHGGPVLTAIEEIESENLLSIGIQSEWSFTATRNYSPGSFLSVHGVLYEVLSAIPRACSIVLGQNVVKTTIEHYLDALKEKET